MSSSSDVGEREACGRKLVGEQPHVGGIGCHTLRPLLYIGEGDSDVVDA